MLVLRTGLMGHGKTLNAIKELDTEAKRQDRPVFYHNVTGLDPSKLSAKWYEFEDPLLWYELPHDSFIVIDEAQGDELKPMFGVRDPRKPVPLHVSRFETMRKQGHEVHLITQDPRLIDVHARRLVNKHIHVWRIFGTSKLSRYELPRVHNEVEKLNQAKDADRTTITLDKKYFGVYSSAQAKHHFKFQPSRKAVIFAIASIVALFFVGRAAMSFYSHSPDSTEPEEKGADSTSASSIAGSFLGTGTADNAPQSVASYLGDRIPRIPNIPSSAPVYDELAKPQSFPRLFCASSTDPNTYAREFSRMPSAVVNGKQTVCQCYTQQATRFHTDFSFCMDVVDRGYFDPTRVDPNSQGQYQAQQLQQPQIQSQAPVTSQPQPQQSGAVVTVVGYEKGRFLW